MKRNASASDVPRNRAFVLVLAVGFVAVAMILAMSFATRTTLAVPQASNRAAAARAHNLAASGIEIAAHFLMVPPAGVTACTYWTGTGATGISIDGTADNCTISVSPTGIDQRMFTVRSTGVAFDSAGVQRATRTIKADILLPPPNQWCIQQVCVAGNTQSFPGRLNFSGNVHANGDITSIAWCNGTVTATGVANWPGLFQYGPPSSVQSNQPWQRVPPIAPADWSTYTVNGAAYSATSWGSQDLTGGAWVNSGGVISSANPGGVLVSTNYSGGVAVMRLKNNVNFAGTLVVPGDLELDGNNVRVTAVSDYPAIVVSRDLVIRSDNVDLTVNGPVLVGGMIRKGVKTATLRFTGPVITTGSFDDSKPFSSFQINYGSTRTTWYNPGGEADSQPYTILDWNES